MDSEAAFSKSTRSFTINTVGTLDESIYMTIQRDLKNIVDKMNMVLHSKMNKKDVLNDWDLWGPLLFCLLLSINLGLSSLSSDESASIFTLVFVIVWCGSAIVTINSKLLGGDISFFQSICVIGYCISPLVIASYICLLFNDFIFPRFICVSLGLSWSVNASIGFLSECVTETRRTLAIYPIFLFYLIVSWMIMMAS